MEKWFASFAHPIHPAAQTWVEVFDPAPQRHGDDAKTTPMIHPAAQETKGKDDRPHNLRT
jgi:hypothetical protein